MPEKSVRQMSRFEREHNSLSARTFRAIISSSILIGLVALLIGLGLFVYVLTTRYIDTAFNASKIAESITEKVLDVKPTVESFSFAGKEHASIACSSTYMGVPLFERQVFVKVGRYIGIVTSFGFSQEDADSFLGFFSAA